MSTFDRLADLAPERVRPLKRVEYERLVSEGLFDDERIELLGGVIVEMSPQDTRHAALIERLDEVIRRGHRTGYECPSSIKSELYARADVPEYWIVNIAERQIEVRTTPKDGAYQAAAIARPGDVMRVPSLGGAEIAVSDVLR